MVLVPACLWGWSALCGALDDTASQASAEARPFAALLLPLSSPAFAGAAQAVERGCRAAMAVEDKPLPLQVSRTDATPESILAAYRSAAERGAAIVLGPLTRDGVTALARTASSGPPTLALNAPDADTPLPPRFVLFGLSAESEARAAAQNAFSSGARSAAMVESDAPLSRRVSRAFVDEWQSLGGTVSEHLDAGADLELMRRRMDRSQADMVFLATDGDVARTVRPYLNSQVPVYATSLVHGRSEDPLAAVDLDGIRFVDMPWLVQPDHPAVMVYPRPTGSVEFQRFYALGIDACRLAPLVAAGHKSGELDGVTGHLQLAHGAVERDPVPALFRAGSAVAADASETPR